MRNRGIATGGAAGLAVGLVAVATVIGLVANGASMPSRAFAVGAARTGPDPDGAGGRAAPRADAAAARGVVPAVSWVVQRGDGAWLYGRGERVAGVLPARETGLAASDSYIATVLPAGDGRSIVRLRATATGRRIADARVGIWVSAGTWSPNGLLVTGYRDVSTTADGGLLLLSLPDLVAKPLVPAGPFSAALGEPVARGDVVVSASGRFAATDACGPRGCDTQVVDLASGEVAMPTAATEGFLRAVTDDAIVTTDDDGRWIEARDIRTGALRWRISGSVLLDPVSAAGGSVVGVAGSARSGWGVVAIDRGGHIQDLTARVGRDAPWPRIWRQVSTPAGIVVGTDRDFAEALARGRSTPVVILSVGGDAPRAATVTIDSSILAGAVR